MKLIAAYTTVGNLEDARKIAEALVARKLVACAQISEIESYYRWEGEMKNEREFRIVLKTASARYPAVEAAIRELHAYETPAIYAVALGHAFEPYARWVEECSLGE